MQRKNILYSFPIMIVILALTLGGCSTNIDKKETEVQATKKIQVEKNPVVTIVMENDKQIKVELYPEIAPNTVLNFISLVQKGFYDGLTFHRVIPGFMIQGGDPEGTGSGGPGYTIKGEFSSNGFKNNVKHETGIISMARSNNPDSTGSQFFIMVKNASHLDGNYAAFGKVIEGMETVNEIVNVERNSKDKPIQEQKMKKVTVETFGEKYDQPEVILK